MIKYRFTENLTTHKLRVVRESAKADNWELLYKCTDAVAMNHNIVLVYAWNQCELAMLQIKHFRVLARQICRLLSEDEIQEFVSKRLQNWEAAKSATIWVDFEDWYCLPIKSE